MQRFLAEREEKRKQKELDDEAHRCPFFASLFYVLRENLRRIKEARTKGSGSMLSAKNGLLSPPSPSSPSTSPPSSPLVPSPDCTRSPSPELSKSPVTRDRVVSPDSEFVVHKSKQLKKKKHGNQTSAYASSQYHRFF